MNKKKESSSSKVWLIVLITGIVFSPIWIPVAFGINVSLFSMISNVFYLAVSLTLAWLAYVLFIRRRMEKK